MDFSKVASVDFIRFIFSFTSSIVVIRISIPTPIPLSSFSCCYPCFTRKLHPRQLPLRLNQSLTSKKLLERYFLESKNKFLLFPVDHKLLSHKRLPFIHHATITSNSKQQSSENIAITTNNLPLKCLLILWYVAQ